MVRQDEPTLQDGRVSRDIQRTTSHSYRSVALFCTSALFCLLLFRLPAFTAIEGTCFHTFLNARNAAKTKMSITAPLTLHPVEDRRQQLLHAVEHAAHFLPAQGPIGVFIHHN